MKKKTPKITKTVPSPSTPYMALNLSLYQMKNENKKEDNKMALLYWLLSFF